MHGPQLGDRYLEQPGHPQRGVPGDLTEARSRDVRATAEPGEPPGGGGTVFFNGVVVQNDVALDGPTQYIGKPSYAGKAHGPAPIKLQAHGDKSEPLSFRNIWVREM